MAESETLKKAIQHRYVAIQKDKSKIRYLCRNYFEDDWRNPEEKVRAEVYAWLIFERGFSPQQIEIEAKVSFASIRNYRVDILVYRAMDSDEPILIVECKREGTSGREAAEARGQTLDYLQSKNRTGTLKNVPGVLFCAGATSEYYEPDRDGEFKKKGSQETVPRHVAAEALMLLEVDSPMSPIVAKDVSKVRPEVVYSAAIWGPFDVLLHVQQSSAQELFSSIATIQEMSSIVRTAPFPIKPHKTMPLNVSAFDRARFRAIVLLQVRPSQAQKILDYLRDQARDPDPGSAQILHAAGLLGGYDIAALIGYRSDNELSDFVMRRIQGVWKGAIRETSTIPFISGMTYRLGEAKE